MKSARLPWVFLALALSSVSVSWAWMHLGPEPDGNGLWLKVAQSVQGYRFESEPLTDIALSMLNTAHYLNGDFRAEKKNTITIFAADWTSSGGDLTVVQHTPDICWVQGGWTYGEMVGLRQVMMSIPRSDGEEMREIPFECRVFVSPDGQRRELTVWCTLIGGAPMVETPSNMDMPGLPAFFQHGKIRGPINRTRLAVQKFVSSVKKKIPSNGSKQFIRFSTTLTGEYAESLERLEAFAAKWITFEKYGIVGRNTEI